MGSVASGFIRKFALEFGTNHSTVPMSTSYFSPDDPGFVHFATRSHCAVLCFVHIRTSLAQIQFRFISSINIFSFKKSSVLPLVLETSR